MEVKLISFLLNFFILFLFRTSEIACWMYASERQTARLRIAYLKAVLSQEIGAFDTKLTSGKIMSGISNHMSLIQDAIGEKVNGYSEVIYLFFFTHQLFITEVIT